MGSGKGGRRDRGTSDEGLQGLFVPTAQLEGPTPANAAGNGAQAVVVSSAAGCADAGRRHSVYQLASRGR